MKYNPKKKFMKIAIDEAIKANKKYGEFPIGAVVVKEDKLISKSGNFAFRNKDTCSHAELIAIKRACQKLKTKYLHDCILYSTNEPCVMCTGSAIWAEMKGIVFGANIKDMEEFWIKKKGIKKKNWKMIYISCKEVLKKSQPKGIFLIENFMGKECKKLFDEKLYSKSRNKRIKIFGK